MKLISKTLVIGLVLMGGMALAEDKAKDPTVIAWKELMGKNGAAAKILSEMAEGKMAFDQAIAQGAKDALIADAKATPAAFETQASDPVSAAKPEIWTNWDDFVAKSGALATAAEALDVSSAASIGAGMAAVGGACGACHKAYKAKL